MKSTRFDQFTKELANSTSRRQVLRVITVGSISGIVGLRATDTAHARNMTCAHFCASVFGESTPAAEQCAADAAHHKGLCYTCGPASPGGTKAICCVQNPDGTCASYSAATCCASGQTCSPAGTCV